jgi:hypothetical protein
MRSIAAAILAPILLLGCQNKPLPPGSAGTWKAVGQQVQCINLDEVVSRQAAGPQAILFRMTGGRSYRNDLAGSCPGLARSSALDVIQVETAGPQLCRDDSVRVYDPVQAKAVGAQAFAKCRLGAFTRVGNRVK